MSAKTEIVVYWASYCKVFSASVRRMSFSTGTPDFDSQLHVGGRFLVTLLTADSLKVVKGWIHETCGPAAIAVAVYHCLRTTTQLTTSNSRSPLPSASTK